ncbi:hypothetical protein PR202_gb10131 [Eleusine coracana subsp. coracana]|uniref:Uncharacterized protein n=1 Tax=Eleusine coracana subsp. coracana TaxID=191504 RepID=A0AAV5EJM9_ELECO|nr:hypothetical protein PR202_gb10131 [Eleusine coracana subsp. coracana]
MATSVTSAVGNNGVSGGPSEGDGSTTKGRSYYERLGYPDAASLFEAKRQETLGKYMTLVSPILQPVLAKDSDAKLEKLSWGWSHFMGLREFIFPEVFLSIISMNAVRCAKVVLSGDDRRRADPTAGTASAIANLQVDI